VKFFWTFRQQRNMYGSFENYQAQAYQELIEQQEQSA
jgi:hypothetical protein